MLNYYPRNADYPATSESVLEMDFHGNYVRRNLSSQEKDQLTSERTRIALADHFKHSALVRYFEAWEDTPGTGAESFVRGVSGKPAMKTSFAGMVGSANKKAVQKVNGKWKVIDREKLYPSVQPFPPEGIERMRSFAREMSRQRKVNNL